MKTNENLHYVGSFSTLQTEGSSNLMNYGTKYTAKQQELYYRLLKGLKIYSPEELYSMNSTKKLRINKAHEKAQRIINKFKHERSVQLLKHSMNQVLNKEGFFDNFRSEKKESSFDLLFDFKETDAEFLCTLPFDALSITKEDIIIKFKAEKLLPVNFDSL
jgi:hypothetical protein